MAQNFALITYDHDGHSFDLLSLDDAARAVAAGRIRTTTQLTVYAADGSISVRDAVDVPEIARLLDAPPSTAQAEERLADIVPPPAIAPTPSPAPAPPPQDAFDAETLTSHDYVLRHSFSDGQDGPAYLVRWCVEPGASFEAGDLICIVQTEFAIIRIPAPGAGRLVKKLVRTHSPVSIGTALANLRLDWRPEKELAPEIRYFVPPEPVAADSDFVPDVRGAPARYRSRRLGCGGWIALCIFLLAAAVFVKNWAERPRADDARAAAVTVENSDAGAADFRPEGEVVDRYLARRASLFARPDAAARLTSQLERGGAVSGIYVRNTKGEDWFWLAESGAEQRYIRASDLTQRQPPLLIDQRERRERLVSDTEVFVWPDTAASAQVDDDGTTIALSAGATVTVLGATDTEFYEIALTEAQGGGVGYIARAAVDGGTVLAPADSLLDRGIASASSALKEGARMALSSSNRPALKVINQCPMTATILFYYRTPAGWTHQRGSSWDYRSGDSGYPTLPNGERIYPVNGELFYAAAPSGQGPLVQGRYDKAIVINGQEYHFRRARLDTLGNGDYAFTLSC